MVAQWTLQLVALIPKARNVLDTHASAETIGVVSQENGESGGTWLMR